MTIYLNDAASAWPKAPGVIEAMQQALSEPPRHPGRTICRPVECVTECRARLAALIGSDEPSRIVLTMNASHALNLAIFGLPLNAGDHVITTCTEHNSVLRPLLHLRRDIGIRLTLIGLDATGALDRTAYLRALDEAPKLVAINHASNVTGRVNPVDDFFPLAKARGAVTLLDASQSLGHRPVRVDELQADLIAMTGHKGLRGPAGTGALYVAPHLTLRQVFVGGTGSRSNRVFHPEDMPMRLEVGTPNVPSLAGLAAALRWHGACGEAFIRTEQARAEALRAALREIPGVELIDDMPHVERLGVVSFRLAGWPVDEMGYVLAQSFGITTRTGLHCAPLIHTHLGCAPLGTVRLSVSGFTTDEEIAAAAAAIRSMSHEHSQRL